MFRRTLTCLAALVLLAAQPADRDPHTLPPDAKDILDRAEKMEVFSIEPGPPRKDVKETFRGWKVLGKTDVADAETRKRLAAALEKGVANHTGGGAKCFNPRHGLRASVGDKTAEFVICFECFQARVTAGGKDQTVYVSRSPAGAFNEVLRKAGVPLAEGAEGK